MLICSSIKKIIISAGIILLILFTKDIFSQNLTPNQLDSIYYKFLQLNGEENLIPANKISELTAEDRKCGFGIFNYIKINLTQFSEAQQMVLKPFLQRPIMQTSAVSPSGFFRVHFDTTGVSIPSYKAGSVSENILEVLHALDSTYNYEINFLGYPSPPPDNGEGGDDKYDVYIINQPSGLYGFTQFENEIEPGSDRFTSYMVIDNDYTGYFSNGVNGLRVTAAHEFHHAVQVGNYIFRSDDTYFYELTSTSMEEFVYDDVNDYYQYLDSYFRRPDRVFRLNSGYNLAIWNIYLNENFNADIIKQQWEQMPVVNAIMAINNSLIFNGSSFPQELNTFGIWTYYTDYRAVPGLYFKEAANYPLVAATSNVQFTPPSQRVLINAGPTTNNFIRYSISSNADTLYAIISNGDAVAANENSNQTFSVDYTLFSDGTTGDRELTENYSADFFVDNSVAWSVSEILNDIIVRRDSVINQPAGSLSYAYPNPYSYNKNYLTGSLIFFPTSAVVGETVGFNVYSTGMQLIFSSEKNIQNLPGSQKGVSWNGLDNNGSKLASGVYIFVIKKGDDVEKGKVVIFNE